MKKSWILLLFFGLALGERAPEYEAYDFPPQAIVGGQDSVRGEFPFAVKIYFGGGSCAGSLVYSEFSDTVLTAKHCLDDG